MIAAIASTVPTILSSSLDMRMRWGGCGIRRIQTPLHLPIHCYGGNWRRKGRRRGI